MEQRGPNSIFSNVSVSVTLAHMAITLAYKEEIPVGTKRLPDCSYRTALPRPPQTRLPS